MNKIFIKLLIWRIIVMDEIKEKNEEPEETSETLEQVDFMTMLLELEHR